jgi:outer membrane immunogenic protein
MSRLLLTSALLVACSSAFAADAPNRRSAPPVFTQAPPIFTWTGFYVGANAGAVFGDFTKGAKFIDTKTGFTGGITAGYNQQFGQFVAGLEGDYNYSGLDGRGFSPTGSAVKGELTSFGTARGRLGVAFDRALVYATGGYAFGFNSLRGGGFKDDNTSQGYVIGGGLEYAFTQNISAKAEYLYMPLRDSSSSSLSAMGISRKTGIDANIIRAGVNYRF